MKDSQRIEILGWDDDGIEQLVRVTAGDKTYEAYIEPDVESLSPFELKSYIKNLERKLSELEGAAPKDEESDEYDEWADECQYLEELIELAEGELKKRS